jgi:hypothetical protein
MLSCLIRVKQYLHTLLCFFQLCFYVVDFLLLKTYLNILNLFSKFKQYSNYSLEDILLTCFFLVMRSKYLIESTNICFEDIRLHYKLNKDRISKLLELELIIFSIVGFRIPEEL